MVTKCLVRSLYAEVDNPDLPRINSLKISLTNNGESGNTGNFKFNLDGVSRLELEGNAYFTDSTFTDNNGKTQNQGGAVYVHVTSGTASLFVMNMNTATGTFKLYWYDSSLVPKTQLKYISYDIREVFQNDTSYSYVWIGGDGEAVSQAFVKCYGDISTVPCNAQALYLTDCINLSGDLGQVIAEQATESNLNTVTFSNCPVTLDLSSLNGKKYLYLKVAGRNVTGDIKYFADTRNEYIWLNLLSTREVTGTVEELVARAITNGKVGTYRSEAQEKQYSFSFAIGSPSSPNRYTNVTYNNKPLKEYYDEYISENPQETRVIYMKFTWDAQGEISYEIGTSEIISYFIPKSAVV